MTSGVRADTVIDLLHPGGFARDVAVIGSACPGYLLETRPAITPCAGSRVAAVLIVPARRECMTAGWLDRAATDAAALLHPEGLCYAIVDRRWRRAFLRTAEGRGLEISATFVHTRHGSSSDYFIPCDPAVARYVGTQVPTTQRRRRAWQTAWALPYAASMISSLGPDIGIVLRHPGSPPPLQWLRHADVGEYGNALIRVKKRGDAATAVLTLFASRAASPSVVLKAALSDAADAHRVHESWTLSCLAPAAEHAGAMLPRVHRTTLPSGRSMLCLQRLSGRPASAVLTSSPERVRPVADLVTTWLERWALATRRTAVADAVRLENAVLQPAATLAPLLAGGDTYVATLRELCMRACGTPLPIVDVHGDLSMSNVLLDGDRPLSIVDWESACADGLPLTDFFYAAADMVAAAGGYRDRVAAFAACCDPRTEPGSWVSAAAQRLAAALDIRETAVEVLRHATVLQHACNELRDGSNGHAPFRAMVQYLCDRRVAQQACA